ncbi:MarR family winged helix-turn-helix transcriptional regulator [Ammoniphilus sp. CFH 90114]|uniref:MarR family winged helix-turn-helix transcriptional regulator n=1 Tax=Ammoniphilus sp. CFH 90114 TaxID=2493665 RepID=UPI00100E35B8|nr:MarR family transcriptional regulator [Ammoniphilus sp. CFH 90114]RXT13715.1 MarR family transcriptional regulator [Ammoniphilus sp. CFH 90114]
MNQFEQLLIALKQVHESFVDIIQSNDDSGLTHANMFLLFMIHGQGSIKTTDISKYFDITPGAATAIADKLESLGLIARERDKKDRRVVVISLTDQGKEFLQRKRNKNVKLFEEILKDFTYEEITSVISSLQKITQAIAIYKGSK